MLSAERSSTAAFDGSRIAVVTGASGFVGSRALLALSSRGWHVRACSRTAIPAPTGRVKFFSVPRLDDQEKWDQVLPGADVIVHCAGLAHVPENAAIARLDEFTRVNVQGTVALASAALRHGVRRFVFISSIGVNGNRTVDRPFRAEDPTEPKGVYADSKLKAELALAELARGKALETVVIRPCLVIGPGAPGNLERLVGLLRRGWWLPFGAIENRRSLISVDALSELIAIAAEHPAASGRVFLAAQGMPVSTTEIIRALARGAGVRPRLIRVPVPVLRLLGSLAGRTADIDRLCDSLEVDASAARDFLGWTCGLSVLADLERVPAANPDV